MWFASSWTAPENQLFSNCSILSDMFSLGLVMCTIFNQGHALIQANNSASTYLKQLEAVSCIVICWIMFHIYCIFISVYSSISNSLFRILYFKMLFQHFISLLFDFAYGAIEMNVKFYLQIPFSVAWFGTKDASPCSHTATRGCFSTHR